MKCLLRGACALAMAGLAYWGADRGPEQAEAEGARPILALGALHPRISPDGTAIAFSYQGAIWTVPAAGGTMTRLTEGEGFDTEPAWSPDGKRLAFVRGSELRLIRAAGSHTRPASYCTRRGYWNGRTG